MATMFPCPGCGGQLRYSVKNKKLKCESCGNTIEVEEYKSGKNINADTIDTSVYVCPNCAGEIQLIDNDGMEFCPFCGTQATMQEKFSTEGAPKYILPFMISKKQAKNRYKSITEHIHFVPDGLEQEENIDKMVPMFVPYYLYEYSVNDDVAFKGTRTYESGQYQYTNRANVDVNVDVNHMKVAYDASQALDDSIAKTLKPFPMDEIRDFNAGYLAGSFVENSSVEKDLYVEESRAAAVDSLYGQVVKNAKGYTPDFSEKYGIETQLANDIQYEGPAGAYMPLYFLTSRYDDRVAYSIVNGATGNTYTDIPIDKRKMFKSASLISGIIFAVLLLASFILNFSFNVKNLCSIGGFFSSIIAYLGAYYANKVYRADNHLDDKGYFGTKDEVKKNKIKPKKSNNLIPLSIVCFSVVCLLMFVGGASFIALLMSFGFIVMALFSVKKGKKKVMLLGIWGWFLSVLIRLVNPSNDLYYYGSLIIAFIVILVAMHTVVDEYNRFATHPSPHFSKKGGGLERARD